MHAENLVKVARIGGVMGRRRPPTLRKLYLKFAVKIVLSKHVVLVMQIINIIINIDNIRQKRPNEGPILKLNKRLK